MEKVICRPPPPPKQHTHAPCLLAAGDALYKLHSSLFLSSSSRQTLLAFVTTSDYTFVFQNPLNAYPFIISISTIESTHKVWNTKQESSSSGNQLSMVEHRKKGWQMFVEAEAGFAISIKRNMYKYIQSTRIELCPRLVICYLGRFIVSREFVY